MPQHGRGRATLDPRRLVRAVSQLNPATVMVQLAEHARTIARELEPLELGSVESRSDLRAVIGDLRYNAGRLLALAALETPPQAAGRQRHSCVRDKVG